MFFPAFSVSRVLQVACASIVTCSPHFPHIPPRKVVSCGQDATLAVSLLPRLLTGFIPTRRQCFECSHSKEPLKFQRSVFRKVPVCFAVSAECERPTTIRKRATAHDSGMKLQRLDRLLVKLLKKQKGVVRAAIGQGKVAVNGRVETDFHRKISVFCRITWDEDEVYSRKAYYIMLHKPKGYVSATKDTEHPCVVDLFPREEAWTQELRLVGRLDRFTTGLLLMTNDGYWSQQISCPVGQATKTPKKYLVTTMKEIDAYDDAVLQFQKGLHLPDNDVTCRPSILEKAASGEEHKGEASAGEAEMKADSSVPHQYYFTLYEGKRHQVKCMVNAISMSEEPATRNRVIDLHRISIGNLQLDPMLKEGEWRFLTAEEADALAVRSSHAAEEI